MIERIKFTAALAALMLLGGIMQDREPPRYLPGMKANPAHAAWERRQARA